MRETASARRQALRHVASILDSARKLGIRDAQGRDVTYRREEEDEFGLKELDGQLRWPGKSRRR